MPFRPEHWNEVYEAREETALTWFEAEPTLSLALIESRSGPENAVIDIGGGASRLVDALVADGYRAVTVLDVSQAALQQSRKRLGPRADAITWIEADITEWWPDRVYSVWHDRAVFHFLTEPADRAAYVAAMSAALLPGGTAIIATFAEDGPERCSGLPVVRYAPANLAATIEALAPGVFEPVEAHRHEHVTPKGGRQMFQVSVFRKSA